MTHAIPVALQSFEQKIVQNQVKQADHQVTKKLNPDPQKRIVKNYISGKKESDGESNQKRAK